MGSPITDVQLMGSSWESSRPAHIRYKYGFGHFANHIGKDITLFDVGDLALQPSAEPGILRFPYIDESNIIRCDMTDEIEEKV
jgi:hypothetical protein